MEEIIEYSKEIGYNRKILYLKLFMKKKILVVILLAVAVFVALYNSSTILKWFRAAIFSEQTLALETTYPGVSIPYQGYGTNTGDTGESILNNLNFGSGNALNSNAKALSGQIDAITTQLKNMTIKVGGVPINISGGVVIKKGETKTFTVSYNFEADPKDFAPNQTLSINGLNYSEGKGFSKIKIALSANDPSAETEGTVTCPEKGGGENKLLLRFTPTSSDGTSTLKETPKTISLGSVSCPAPETKKKKGTKKTSKKKSLSK